MDTTIHTTTHTANTSATTVAATHAIGSPVIPFAAPATSRLAGVALAALLTMAMLAGVDGLAGSEHANALQQLAQAAGATRG